MRRLALVPLLLLLAPPAPAGTIVQTAGFHVARAGMTSGTFDRLDPALMPLNGMLSEVRAAGISDTFTIRNTSSAAVSVTVRATDILGLAPGPLATFVHAFTFVDLPPGQAVSLAYAITGGPASIVGLAAGSHPSYVGTGAVAVAGFDSEVLTADNAAVEVRSAAGVGGGIPTWDGTQTLTYYFGPTQPVPAPASLVLLATGLAGAWGWKRLSPGRGSGNRAA